MENSEKMSCKSLKSWSTGQAGVQSVKMIRILVYPWEYSSVENMFHHSPNGTAELLNFKGVDRPDATVHAYRVPFRGHLIRPIVERIRFSLLTVFLLTSRRTARGIYINVKATLISLSANNGSPRNGLNYSIANRFEWINGTWSHSAWHVMQSRVKSAGYLDKTKARRSLQFNEPPSPANDQQSRWNHLLMGEVYTDVDRRRSRAVYFYLVPRIVR